MEKHEKGLSSEAILLDKFLSQYKRCINKKRTLEHRQKSIRWELDHPLHAVSYDGMPRGISESIGCAAISFRLDEINTRIEEQKERAVKILAEIMDVIDFLPENSIERDIVEYRYIDLRSWKWICKEENISRTPGTRHWRKALYELLEFKKVQKILKEYEDNEGEQ